MQNASWFHLYQPHHSPDGLWRCRNVNNHVGGPLKGEFGFMMRNLMYLCLVNVLALQTVVSRLILWRDTRCSEEKKNNFVLPKLWKRLNFAVWSQSIGCVLRASSAGSTLGWWQLTAGPNLKGTSISSNPTSKKRNCTFGLPFCQTLLDLFCNDRNTKKHEVGGWEKDEWKWVYDSKWQI